MSTIFLFEFISGGGFAGSDVPGSLRREGLAMLEALSEDLAAIPAVDIVSLLDDRVEAPGQPCQVHRVRSDDDLSTLVAKHAAAADGTILIAPEIGGSLSRLAKTIVDSGGRLLGGSLAAIELAADKLHLAERLVEVGVPTLPTSLARAGSHCDAAAVVKPRRGAGSIGVRLVEAGGVVPHLSHESVLTPLRDGVPASVLLIAAGPRVMTLQPTRQILSGDGRFEYLGGSFPLGEALDDPLATRAIDLARRAVESLPDPLGFFGVDLLLDPLDRSADVVVEVNPRLTTSYCGLRHCTKANLAALLLDVVECRNPTEPRWLTGTRLFSTANAS